MHDLSQIRQLSIDVMDNQDNEDYVDDEADLETPHGVAFQSRLKQDKLTVEESQAFPEIVDDESALSNYFFIRNSILKFWFKNPKVCFYYVLVLSVVFNHLQLFFPDSTVDRNSLSQHRWVAER